MNPPNTPTETESLVSAQPTFADKDQKFACQECPAKCCRYPWNIIVTQAEYEQYMATDWMVQKLREENVEITAVKNNYSLPRTRKADGDLACVFLTDDNMCSVQVKEGHDFLPYTCQSYPFRFTAQAPKVGEGEETTAPHGRLSFFCRSIQQNYGEPVGQKLKFKYKKAREAGRIEFLPTSSELGKQLTLPDSTYTIISVALTHLFENPSVPVADALWQGRCLLEHLIDEHEPGSMASVVSVKKVLDAYAPEKVRPQLSELPAGTMIGKTVLALKLFNNIFYAMQDDFPKHPTIDLKKMNGKVLLLKVFMDLLMEQGEYPYWGLPKWVNMNAVKQMKVDEDRPEFQALLRRYYQQFFSSNSLFGVQADVLKGYFILGVTYPYILRVARFNAFANDRDTVTEADLIEAMGYADLLCDSISVRTKNTFIFEMKEKILTLIAFRLESFAKVLRSEAM